ncbi:MAG: SprB repeat-containing protein, partial [Bacteroidota bacterium]
VQDIFFDLNQPEITASNISCTNITTSFNSLSNNSWSFSPSGYTGNLSGSLISGEFSNIDRYDVTSGVNFYEGFHNVILDGGTGPEIFTTANQLSASEYQLCEGDFATFSTTTSAATFTWDFDGAIANPSAQINNLGPFNAPGTYNVTLFVNSDCCGVSPTTTITLYVDDLPSASAVSSTAVNLCRGDAAELEISAGNADLISWSPTSGLYIPPGQTVDQIVEVAPATTTTYIATILEDDFSGQRACPQEISFTVTVNDPPVITLNTSDAVCGDIGSATALPTGSGISYLWSTGETTGTIAGLAIGNYAVTVTEDFGGGVSCSSEETFSISPGAAGFSSYIETSTNLSCFGADDGTATANFENSFGPPITYTWEGPNSFTASTQSITGLEPGEYTVTVSTASFCEAEATVMIGEPDEIAISSQDLIQPLCGVGGMIEINAEGGTGGLEYLWNNGTTASSVSNAGAGSYSVTITDESNCALVQTFDLIDATSFMVAINTVDNVCEGDTNGEATAVPSGGTGPYTYLWSQFGQTTATITGLPSNTYSVTVTDATGCSLTETTSIGFQNTVPILQVGVDIIVTENTCFGVANGTAEVISVQNGSYGTDPANYTFLWSNGQTTPLATGFPPDIHGVTVFDALGCNSGEPVNVGFPPPVFVSLTATTPTIDCFDGGDGIVTASATGGIPPYTYAW